MAITNPVALLVLYQQLLTAILVLIYYETSSVTGMLTLSPMMVAPVCHIGDPLQLMCTASVEFIIWNIFQVNEQGTLVEVANSVLINAVDANQMSHRVVNSTTFTYMRSSAEDVLPLISSLSIDSVSISLNGTVVQCTDVANPMVSASTTIQIIDTSQNIQYVPTLSISEELFRADNVTVTVKWTPADSAQHVDVSYSPRVVPYVPIPFTGSTSHQLTIPYNTEYNFSLVATTPCRPNATSLIQLYYANCGHPDLLPMCKISNDSLPNIVGYDNLPIEGSTITFSCPPGLVLIGPSSATCTENGEWEPDTRWLICRESGMIHMEESRYTCSGVLAAALSSTVIISLVISIVTFITGFICGNHFRIKFRFFKGKPHTTTDHPQQAPEYEDIDAQPITRAVKHQEQGLELKENVAYGQSKVHES